MRNHRGQALIEFLLIMPVIFIILMAMFDFGNILYHRYKLENELDYVVGLYLDNKEEELNQYLEENDFTMDVAQDNAIKTIYLRTDISIFTPGLSQVLGSSYRVDTSKTVYEG